jgi:ABC-type transport system involved in cytochrome bd biosynthesis fused ATPase/permease subunit
MELIGPIIAFTIVIGIISIFAPAVGHLFEWVFGFGILGGIVYAVWLVIEAASEALVSSIEQEARQSTNHYRDETARLFEQKRDLDADTKQIENRIRVARDQAEQDDLRN